MAVNLGHYRPASQPVCVHVFSPTQFPNTELWLLHWMTTPDIILASSWQRFDERQPKVTCRTLWPGAPSYLLSQPRPRSLCSPALTTCRSPCSSETRTTDIPECGQLLSEGRGHLPRVEGRADQQGVVSDVAGQTKSIQGKQLHSARL